MESQQVAAKVAQLEARVAALEDEGKIVKGEVKQILTEIRSAILVRDNPFESEGGFGRRPSFEHASDPVAKVAVTLQEAPHVAPPPEVKAEPQAPPPAAAPTDREPIPLRPELVQRPQPMAAPPVERPDWSLLTIASLYAWAEDAIVRLGPLRLEILLDLCEAAGHVTPEAREALSRVTELEVPEPARAPSTNETAAILRQLEALVTDEEEHTPARTQRRA